MGRRLMNLGEEFGFILAEPNEATHVSSSVSTSVCRAIRLVSLNASRRPRKDVPMSWHDNSAR
jgi:hypothetical protein